MRRMNELVQDRVVIECPAVCARRFRDIADDRADERSGAVHQVEDMLLNGVDGPRTSHFGIETRNAQRDPQAW